MILESTFAEKREKKLLKSYAHLKKKSFELGTAFSEI
jgi:hypothetical protein